MIEKWKLNVEDSAWYIAISEEDVETDLEMPNSFVLQMRKCFPDVADESRLLAAGLLCSFHRSQNKAFVPALPVKAEDTLEDLDQMRLPQPMSPQLSSYTVNEDAEQDEAGEAL